MSKTFEDEFMDLQAECISLCLEVVGQEAEKIYAYCSIETYSKLFNAFLKSMVRSKRWGP